MTELDLATLPNLIDEARHAVLDRIEDGLSKPSDGEQSDLRDALVALDVLGKTIEH